MAGTIVVFKDVEPQSVSRKLAKGLVNDCAQNLTTETMPGIGNHNPLQLDTTIDRQQPTEDHATSPPVVLFHYVIKAIGIGHLALMRRRLVATNKAEVTKLLFKLQEKGKVLQSGASKFHSITRAVWHSVLI